MVVIINVFASAIFLHSIDLWLNKALMYFLNGTRGYQVCSKGGKRGDLIVAKNLFRSAQKMKVDTEKMLVSSSFRRINFPTGKKSFRRGALMLFSFHGCGWHGTVKSADFSRVVR